MKVISGKLVRVLHCALGLVVGCSDGETDRAPGAGSLDATAGDSTAQDAPASDGLVDTGEDGAEDVGEDADAGVDLDAPQETDAEVVADGGVDAGPPPSGIALGEELFSTSFEGSFAAEWYQPTGEEWNESGFVANTEGASAEVSTDYARSGTRALKMMHPGGQNVSPGNRNARTHPTTVEDDLVYTTWYYMPTKLDGRTDGDYFFNNLMDWKLRYNDEPNGLYADAPWMSFNMGVRGGVGSGGNNYLQLAEIRQFSVPGGTTTVYDAGVDLPVGQWWGLRVEVRVDRAASTAQVRGELNIGGAWQSISAWDRTVAYPATSYHGGTKWFEYWYIGNYGRNYQGSWNLYVDDVAVHRVP